MQYLRVSKLFDLIPNVKPCKPICRNSVKTFVKRLFCYRPMNLCDQFGLSPRCVNSVNHGATFSTATRLYRERYSGCKEKPNLRTKKTLMNKRPYGQNKLKVVAGVRENPP